MDVQFKDIERKCHAMKLKALDMALATKFGAHIGGGFSLMEIMACLYEVANIPSSKDPLRDRIILSKGHGVLALYTALWQHGYISEKDLEKFETNGTWLYGHAHRSLSHAIENTGGSLGLGISYATGVAIACKKRGMDNHIYVVLGDGELNEGIVWEAMMAIANFKLNNVTLIVDRNGFQLDGPTAQVMDSSPIEEKLAAFGFDVTTVNGHDIEALMGELPLHGDLPRAIVADTVKANGISFLVGNKQSHQCTINNKKYQQAVAEINAAYGAE